MTDTTQTDSPPACARCGDVQLDPARLATAGTLAGLPGVPEVYGTMPYAAIVCEDYDACAGREQSELPEQPDGIESDSRDLPDPVQAAERVRAYLTAWGDGRCDVADGHPLYARDLEALARAVLDSDHFPIDAGREAADIIGTWLADPFRPSGPVYASARHLLDQIRAAGLTITRDTDPA